MDPAVGLTDFYLGDEPEERPLHRYGTSPDRVELAQDIELPFLGDIRGIGQDRQLHVHGGRQDHALSTVPPARSENRPACPVACLPVTATGRLRYNAATGPGC